MQKKTGVVMEIEGRNAIVLTSTGEFKSIKCRGRMPEIGQEISLTAKPRSIFTNKTAWVAAAAVLLLALISPLSMMALNQPEEKAVAWVTVDINPSLELTVSDSDEVLQATGLNADGVRLLENVNILDMKVDDAIPIVTNQAKKMGYLGDNKDNTVLISVTGVTNEYDSHSLERKLVAVVQNSLGEERLVASVLSVKSNAELRENARKKDLSAGKYAVLIEAVNSKVMVDEKEMKDSSISDAIKNKGGDPEKILQQAQEEQVEELQQKERTYFMIAGEIDRTQNDNDASVATVSPEDGNKTPTNDQTEKRRLIDPIRDGNPEQENNDGKTVKDAVYDDKETVNDATYEDDKAGTVEQNPVNDDGEAQEPDNSSQTGSETVNSEDETVIDNIREKDNSLN